MQPDYAEAFNNRGNALKRLKRPEAALASYNKAIAIKPDYAEAFCNRGIALLGLRRRQEALASLDKAIAIQARITAEAFYDSERGARRARATRPRWQLEKALALGPTMRRRSTIVALRSSS